MARTRRAFTDGLGPEPMENVGDSNYTKVLNWYHQKQYRDFESVEIFSNKIYDPENVEKIRSRQKFLPASVFALCRVRNNGYTIPMSAHNKLINALEAEIKAWKPATPRIIKKPSIPPHIERAMEDLEAAHDFIVNSYGYVKLSLNFTPADEEKKILTDFYKPKLDELVAVIEKTDPDLVEAYRKVPSQRINRLIELYRLIVEVPEIVTEKKERKQRKKRKPNFSKLKFLVADEALELKSVTPESIHGCVSTLIVYNTKYNSVTVYVAKEGQFLEFKRTSVINFDEEKSFSKRAGRSKTLINVLKINNSKHNVLHEIEHNLPSKPSKASSQINGDTILVRGFI